jgi:hypothetical protein
MLTSRDPLYRRHRFPPEVISYAVWLYFRFPLSLRMVEEMLSCRRPRHPGKRCRHLLQARPAGHRRREALRERASYGRQPIQPKSRGSNLPRRITAIALWAFRVDDASDQKHGKAPASSVGHSVAYRGAAPLPGHGQRPFELTPVGVVVRVPSSISIIDYLDLEEGRLWRCQP